MKKNIYKTHRREFLGKRTNCNTASYWQTHLFFWRWAGVFPGLQRQDVGALPCYFLSVVASFLDAKLGYSHTVYITGLRSSECVWGMVILSTLLDWEAQRSIFGGWSDCLSCWVEWLWEVCLGDGHTLYTPGLSGFEECVWGMVILSTLLSWVVLRSVFVGWFVSCLFESDNKL